MDDRAFPGASPDETSHGQTATDTADPADVILVALIEDNRLVREGITSVLNRYSDIRVMAAEPVGTGTLPAEFVPHVVLLDLGLESADSLAVARKLRKDFPDAGIIVLEVLRAEDDIMELISLGVSGFVMKDASLDEVVSTIRAVARGDDVLPDAMTATLFSEIAREAVSNGEAEHLDSVRLTPRELDVVDLIAEGMSNKAIGQALHISIHTVKSHLRNIMEKLTLHSRLQIARYAHNQATSEAQAEGDHPSA